jgi:F-type H+-transporting ATPase subunit gamma
MPSLKAVKNRIASVGKIKKIANALEIVALTRLRRMEANTINSRSYFDKIRELLFDVSANINFKFHPFLQGREPVKNVGIITIFSDKGLCGSFNANVAQKFFKFTSDLKSKKIKVAVAGKKGIRYLRQRTGYDISSTHASSVITEDISNIIEPFTQGFLNGKIDEVFLLYSRFRLHLLGETKVVKLLPFVPSSEAPYERDYIYEPGAYGVFEALVSEYIANQIHHGILESRSAEEMSRMLAMKSASENADEMTAKLRLAYNKTRQANITKELSEVMAAAEAAV